MKPCLFFGLISVLYSHVFAGQIEHIFVGYQEGIYSVDVTMLLDVRQSDAWHIITDYKNLDRINPAIIESEILQRSDNQLKHRMVTNDCILLFCKQLTWVVNINEIDGVSIISNIEPDQSDFEFGETKWHLHPIGQKQTRIYYQKKIKPAFWMPPIIGPVLMKLKIRKEIENSISQIEVLLTNE